MHDKAEKPSILIVDDTPENLDILKNALMDEYKVRPAINGSLALRLALLDPQPDLILLDIMMPDMDGYEVCRHLKRDPRTQEIPVIFVTAKSSDRDELEGLQMGAVDYITKPISAPIVKVRVRTHLAVRSLNREMEEKNRRLYEINERLTDSLEQFSASEERFRSLVQTIPDIVYKIDADGCFTFLNKAIERLGYHQSDLIGKHFSELIHSADIHEASLHKVLEKIGPGTPNPGQKVFDERRSGLRMTVGLEIRLRTKSGNADAIYELKNIDTHIVSVEVNSTGLYGEVGNDTSYRTRQYIGTVGVIRDITDRQKAQNALMEERKLLRQLIDAVPLPIFFFDNNENLIISNDAFQKFVGIDLHQSESVTLNKLFNVTDYLHINAMVKTLLANPTWDRIRQEMELRSLADQIHTFDIILIQFKKSAHAPPSFIGVMADVTEQKAFTTKLIQARKHAEAMAEKADLASRVKGDFLANMSHELRTPLNAVIGLTHLCMLTPLDEQQQDYLNKVSLNANSLLQLINEILDFSKIESGKLALVNTEFTLDDILIGVVAIHSLKSQEKGLEIKLDTKQDVPQRLQGDAQRLGQVLTNLVSNGIKFTEQGEVVITTELVEETPEELVLQFTVRDTGIGMTPEQVNNLFKEFYQGDASSTRKYGGTGLGLAVAKRLVAMMGGEIIGASEFGHGSRFVFTIRCNRQQESTLSHPNPPSSCACDKGMMVSVPPMYGIDVVKGMRNMGGNNALYRTVLLKYARNQKAAGQKMKQFQASGDIIALEGTAAALKGVSLTIGALQVAHLAETIEHQSKMPDPLHDISPLLDTLIDELLQVVWTIETTLTQTDTRCKTELLPQVETTPEALAPLFQQAIALLLNFDSAVETVVDQLAPLVPSGPRRIKLEAIQEALAAYDLETCLTLFQEWATEEGLTHGSMT
ncbi:MAG: ATP-binding protein [Magnetococcus sp. YQC-5]